MGKRSRKRHEPMQHLRAWRDFRGLNTREVGDRLGVAMSTVGKWESGETAIRVQDLELLARVYRVEVTRLFGPPPTARGKPFGPPPPVPQPAPPAPARTPEYTAM